ncbi:DNA-binding protein [Candidatus Atribacteria bacterium 1244-E10-H5-B2]|nr:MAG: DNA-binding protein [Candidatus Atribacteria bacterium 1244-E10-H5-B2]
MKGKLKKMKGRKESKNDKSVLTGLFKADLKNLKDKDGYIWVNGEYYFDVNEMNKMYPLSKETIKKYLRSGEIIGKKIMGVWLVKPHDFWTFIKGRK